MAGLWDVLQIGQSALGASQYGLRVVSNNIANVSTPGYHRQEVVYSEVALPGGVAVTAVRNVRNAILEGRLDGASSRSGAADAQVAGTANIEAIFTDTANTGLSPALSRFFSAWQAVAAAPGDLNARAEVIDSARSVATAFSTAAQNLADARADADGEVGSMVTQANGLIDQIAKLNGSILAAESGGESAADLRDQRDQAQRQLSTLIGSSAVQDSSGQMTIMAANGIVVVQGTDTRPLEAVANAATGLTDISVAGRSSGVLNGSFGGTLGGTLAIRDSVIPRFQAQLDDTASSLTTAVNAVHSSGFGLDGVGGRNLFVPTGAVAGSAIGMSVDPTVAADPRRVAAAQTATSAPGDNRVAAALSALESQKIAIGGTATVGQAIALIKGGAGQVSKSAQAEQEAANAALQQLTDMRDSESGVSLDEQMTLLTQYQRAYQAATKVISTADQMLNTLLTIGS